VHGEPVDEHHRKATRKAAKKIRDRHDGDAAREAAE
jgi:hypothetical protein